MWLVVGGRATVVEEKRRGQHHHLVVHVLHQAPFITVAVMHYNSVIPVNNGLIFTTAPFIKAPVIPSQLGHGG